MERVSRRGFVEAAGAAAAGAWMSPLPAAAAPDTPATDRTVYLAGDGIGLTPACLRGPAGRARRQGRGRRGLVSARRRDRARSSAIGRRCSARRRAVFMPSGTLANHLALRALAGTKRRVIVPETSHIYNDTGDACQTLSGLTLLPLGARRAPPSRAPTSRPCWRARPSGRVATDVGAIAIESPVRRLSGQMFDWDELTGASRRSPASAASACTSTARGCSSPRPTPAAVRPSTRRPSTRSTCRCGSTSTAASARSSPGRAGYSTACSTPAGCSAATWPWAGRRRWSRGTTWTASWSGCRARSRCRRRSIAPSPPIRA